MRARHLGVVAALLATACSGAGADTSSGTTRFVAGDGVAHVVAASAREPGPALSGTTLDGEPYSVSGTGPLVVNVWGSWCAPCKAEQPELERVHRAMAPRGVRFLGINIRDSGITAPKRHVQRYGVTYPSLYDPSSRLLPRFRIAPKTIPSTYVLDRQGRIAAYVYGAVTERTLTELVEQVLAE
jgi:thiol-disulfide isomerase/thioredoxin